MEKDGERIVNSNGGAMLEKIVPGMALSSLPWRSERVLRPRTIVAVAVFNLLWVNKI
jgi:hypothetical protein